MAPTRRKAGRPKGSPNRKGRTTVIRPPGADDLVEKATEKTLTEFQAKYGDLFDDRNPLLPWMKRYAIWLVSRAGQAIPRTEHERAAASFSGYPMSNVVLSHIRMRKGFKEYLASLENDAVEHAKQTVMQDLPYYAETHKKATEKLMAAAEGDPRLLGKVAALTGPMIDRSMPKREERAAHQAIVVINLGKVESEASKLLKAGAEIVDVEFEEVKDE